MKIIKWATGEKRWKEVVKPMGYKVKRESRRNAYEY